MAETRRIGCGYAAYESLIPRSGRSWRAAMRSTTTTTARPREDDRGVAAYEEFAHPIFRTHDETGRKAIYVNRLMTVGIVDMPQEESDPLLNAIFDHSSAPSSSTPMLGGWETCWSGTTDARCTRAPIFPISAG